MQNLLNSKINKKIIIKTLFYEMKFIILMMVFSEVIFKCPGMIKTYLA